jgi:predicted CoA-binding protein
MTDAEMIRLFQEAKTIAVVGLSNSPGRASYGVARFLQAQKFRVIPVNPGLSEVLGEKCYARVQDIPADIDIDIVDIFRKSEFVPEVVADALTKRPRCIWMQEGVVSQEAAKTAEAAGVPVVMDRCILKELARLLPRF